VRGRVRAADEKTVGRTKIAGAREWLRGARAGAMGGMCGCAEAGAGEIVDAGAGKIVDATKKPSSGRRSHETKEFTPRFLVSREGEGWGLAEGKNRD